MASIEQKIREVKAIMQDIPSPCLSVCTLNAANNHLCSGCYRTLDEIASWSVMPDSEKREVWTRIEKRLEQYLP